MGNLYFFEVMTDQQTIAFRPELYLDIAPVRDVKKRSLDRHKSQDPEEIWQAHEIGCTDAGDPNAESSSG